MQNKPYSALAASSQLAPTKANFPALELLLPCSEATGAQSLTDSIHGSVLVTTGAVTNNGDGTLTSTAIWNATTTGGVSNVPAPNGKHVLMFLLGKNDSTAGILLRVGKITAATDLGFSLASSATSPVSTATDGTTLEAGPASSAGDGAVSSWAASFQFGSATGLNVYKVNGAASTIATYAASAGVGDLSAIASPASLPANELQISFHANPALAVVMYFTTLPSAAMIKRALVWMHNNTLVNSAHNKTVWPGFKGMS